MVSPAAQHVNDSSRQHSRWPLIWSFAQRDLKARFTATALGLLWTLIVPLATVLIYSVVFSVIFRAQAPPMGNGKTVFAAWFFCGLVTWNVFSQIANTGMASILGMGPMMQKVYIPSYVPVISSSLAIGIERLLEAGVMLFILLCLLNVGWTWLLYPFVLVLLAVFATSLGYMLAVANVHFRDTGQIFAIVTQMWFFLTPIMYPLDLIPEQWHGFPLRDLFLLNPMTSFVNMSRDLVYGLQLPSPASVAYAITWTGAAFLLALFVYRRHGRDVSEAI
ncbi:MAG TPA: ABC transporter permease [Actinomycetota bacterium]|nr:ABC transporter permease [Actinomycetota bacterium]